MEDKVAEPKTKLNVQLKKIGVAFQKKNLCDFFKT